MFTGIITATGKVKEAQATERGRTVEIEKPAVWKLALGESVAVDGICSTVVKRDARSFRIEYIPETLLKTTAGRFQKGGIVNLERSLTLATLIDGHLTQGHVDTRADIVSVERKNGAHLLTVSIPKPFLRFVAEHGSIAINGVSLTVARLRGARATVALIPHTLAQTNLGALKKGGEVNIEVDLIARYLLKHHERRA